MSNPRYGSKHLCYVCSNLFYDFGKENVICPKCHTDQRNKPQIPNAAQSVRVLSKKERHELHPIHLSMEDQFQFEQDFPAAPLLPVGEGGAKAQQMGKEYEIAVGDILDKGTAIFDEEYPLHDVRSYGSGTDRVDQLIRLGWHDEDRPKENNPLLGFPVACLMETKGQNTSGTAAEKLDHAVRRLALCCKYYKVPKGRIVVSGNAISDDFLRYLNEEAIPDTRTCDGLNMSVIRISQLWRRMRDKLPL